MPRTSQNKTGINMWCGIDHTTHKEQILVIHDTVCKVEICPATNKFRKTKQIEVVC